jgi:hypothetical protein
MLLEFTPAIIPIRPEAREKVPFAKPAKFKSTFARPLLSRHRVCLEDHCHAPVFVAATGNRRWY